MYICAIICIYIPHLWIFVVGKPVMISPEGLWSEPQIHQEAQGPGQPLLGCKVMAMSNKLA